MPVKKPYHEENTYVPIHVNVDMNDQNTGSVGAGVSSRMPLRYVNERGETVSGFFTANETINGADIFRNRMERVLEKPEFAAFGPIAEVFARQVQATGIGNVAVNWYGILGRDTRRPLTPEQEEELRKLDIRALPGPQGAMARNTFLNHLKSKGADPDQLDALKDDPGFWAFCSAMMYASYASFKTLRMHLSHRQAAGGNINKRNNAMYDVAAELGLPGLICRSSSMTVVSGGKSLDGSFMVSARGTDHYLWDPRDAQMGARPVRLTGAAMRQISQIQILDFLCGNVDRHPGNLFYELDMSDPAEIRLVGVQGIDNDESFGTVDYKGKGTLSYMSRLDDIKIIDSELAKTILNSDYAGIEQKVRLAGLSAAEMDGLKERWNALREKIRKGSIKRIQGSDDWDAQAKPEQLDKLRFADERTNRYNIFDNVDFTLKNYNDKVDTFLRSPRKFSKNNPKPAAPAEPPTGKAVTTKESLSLNVHSQELQQLRTQLEGHGSLRSQAPEFMPMYDALQGCIAELSELNSELTDDAPMLTDRQRNRLTERLRLLAFLSDQYVERNDPPAADAPNFEHRRAVCNAAKNIRSYAQNAARSIQRDAQDAEMNMASRMAAEVQKQKDHPSAGKTGFISRPDRSTGPKTTEITYARLQQDLASADKKYIRSSQRFKELREIFERFGQTGIEERLYTKVQGPDGSVTRKLNTEYLMDAQVLYNKLYDAAQRYLDYRVPGGDESKLSSYSKGKVKFARDVLEFAGAGRYQLRQHAKAGVQDEADALQDVRRIHAIGEQLSADADKLLDRKMDAAARRAFEEKFYKEGLPRVADNCRTVLAISAAYPKDHPVQIRCSEFLTGRAMLAILGNSVRLCAKFDPRAKISNGFSALGLTPEEVRDLGTLSKKAALAREAQEKASRQPSLKPQPAPSAASRGRGPVRK